MLAGAHVILFSDDAEATRAFLGDTLRLEGVDAGDGWLVLALPPTEVGVHPGPGWGRATGDHELFFMCRDVEATVAELEGRGVEFVAPPTDEGWGVVTRFRVPGVGEMGLYEPRHPSPLEPFRGEA